MSRRDRLGKGLEALLGEYLEPDSDGSDLRTVSLSAIVPNPLQPRRVFSDDELDELASSIKENGLLQPLVVRPAPGARDRFELVAGERRFRALARLGREQVPVIVRDATDETLLVLALVENLQREALNPLEEAEGYQALADRFQMTQAEIARAVGRSRPTVANFLRLLTLGPSIRKLVADGSLSMGHARALLGVTDPVRAAELARRAAREGWSVRDVEKRVRDRGRAERRATKTRTADPVVRALEEALQETLATRVSIRRGAKGKGTVEIAFLGSEDFERVFEILTGRSVSEVVE